MQKVEQDQRQGYNLSSKTRLSQLYRNTNNMTEQSNNYQSSYQNNNSAHTLQSNKFISQLYQKGYADGSDQNRRQSKLESEKKDNAKINQSNQINSQSDYSFKTPPDQFTKKKLGMNNKQASVQLSRTEQNSSNYNLSNGSPQQMNSTKRSMPYQSPLTKSALLNPNKENDKNNPSSDVHLPKLDSYPNLPQQSKPSQKIEEYYLGQKQQRKSLTTPSDQDTYKLSQKHLKQAQGPSNSVSTSDYDSNTTGTSGSPPTISVSKSQNTQKYYTPKNYYLSKDIEGNEQQTENIQSNASTSNVLAIPQKSIIGSSPRYNIVKYKTNQQKITSYQQDIKKMSEYPNQLIRPLNPPSDQSESSINSSLANNSSDLAQINKFEKKIKQIKETNQSLINLQAEKRNNELVVPQKEITSSLTQYPQSIKSASRKSLAIQAKPSTAKKSKYPIMNTLLKSKAGQYSQFLRKQNQDAGLLQLNFMGDKYASLIGVYDGHGENGTQASNFVKKGILKHLTKEIKQQGGLESENIDIPGCFKRAYQQTNKELIQQNMFDVQMSGCTAVTVLQYKNELYCANTGDSRAIAVKYTSHCDWKQIELSKDHKPELPEERARIVAHGGRVEQSSNEDGEKSGIYRVWKKNQDLPGLAMSRSMGDTMGRECGVIAEPEIIQHTLNDEDKMIIVASDGVWEFLSNQDVTRILTPFYRDGRINEGVDKVISLSHKEWLKEGDSVDDITCIAFFINGFQECTDNQK